MTIRVEWLNDDRTILCFTVREGLNWQDSFRMLHEWLRPMIASTQHTIALVADLRESKLFKADADLFVRRIMQLLGDSVHARAFAVIGANVKYDGTTIISVDSVAEAIEQLTPLLSKNSLA